MIVEPVQETDEPDELCHNCEIEAKKYCNECGGYGSDDDEGDDSEFDCESTRHTVLWIERTRAEWDLLVFDPYFGDHADTLIKRKVSFPNKLITRFYRKVFIPHIPLAFYHCLLKNNRDECVVNAKRWSPIVV